MLLVNKRWMLAEDWAHGHIRDLVEYLSVDFDDCDSDEVAAVYRALAVRLISSGRGDVLIVATQGTPEGHYAVRDVLRTLLRSAAPEIAYRFALCAREPGTRSIFDHVRKEFHRANFEIRVFDYEVEAASWYCSSLPPEEQRP